MNSEILSTGCRRTAAMDWRPAFVAILLLLFTLTATAQEAAPAEEGAAAAEPQPPAAEDIEGVIATLENPESRAELVQALRVLLEAERAEAEAADDGLPTGGDILATVREVIADTWNAIISIDPQQLLLSIVVSVAILVAALLVRWLLVRLLRKLYLRLTTSSESAGEQEVAEVAAHDDAIPEASAERADLPRGIVRLLNLIIGVLAVALIAESWGAGVGELLRTDLGSRIAEAGLAIGLILVITMVAWNISGPVVARLLTLAAGHRDQERTARRLDTLVPLLRSVLQGVIGVLAALLILSELGIDIGPLLAGAGILGLAVGFGAQTLVKDLLTGVTILLEDGASVGDVVEVAGHAGVVEEMRIRLLRLRDLAGAVHLVPYSEVTTIINYTKDFSYYLMEVGVAYREDTDEVCEVLHAVTAGMRGEEPYRGNILDDLEILGVDKFADSAVVIKARLKTRPGQQWSTGREFNRRMKKAFDERNIEIPFPHTTVYFGEPKEGAAPPARLALIDGAAGSD